MDGRDGTRTSPFRKIAALMLLPLLGLAIFFLWNTWNGGETPQQAWEEFRRTDAPKPAAAADVAEEPALPKVTKKKKQRTARASATGTGGSTGAGEIVLIIDDLGFDGQPLDRVMALDPNVNCAVLPNGNRATAVAEKLAAGGFEVLCHLPMEPQGKASPGANAILTSMGDEEIARLTLANVQSIPHARGVNNHMGSRATTDRRVMSTVLGALPEGMYFIDSRTTGGSVASTIARELNVRTASRHVFLDDVATEAAVRRQVHELADAASRHGIAIGIGHPYEVTVRVLAQELPALRAKGFRLVRASEVVR
ncbi:MAG TPA: divergent polysaccharide deacetylase family protein [Thermoanaerobaculia bacterium]